MQKLRIFAASPSDMATERAKVGTAAAMLKPLADAIGIVLDVVDWRAVVPDMGRPERVILEQLNPTEWDVFVGILWHRFGTPPGGGDAQAQREYLSGTEEEFETAYRLWKEHGQPRLMVYRCTRDVALEALDPEQLKHVKEFFAQFEANGGEHPGLYHSFKTAEEFERLLLDNLQHLLLAFGAQLKGAPIEPQVVQTLAPRVPNNLPRRAAFFGRHKDMEVVMRALSPEDRTWGVLVDGIGGIGKTSLAVEAAHRCKESGRFEAFVFVSAKQHALAPGGVREVVPAARTLDEFLNETARVLDQPGIPKLASDAKRRALLDTLRSMPTLLVYDNLETLSKEEREALADFLRELPQGCKAVITSRRRGGEGSVWHRLEKLDWDAARQLIAAEADRDAALAAKLERAEARWQELYDATGGSPLALSHTLGLMRVRAALSFDAALSMLRGSRDADLQQFIFQEARLELTTNDGAALRALSFFAPSATFEAWVEVAKLSRTELETTIDRLSALSLIDVLAGEERYALHPLTRNFVRSELLVNEDLARETGMRFASYWLLYTQRHGGRFASYKGFNLIEAEWANIEAAAEWLWQIVGMDGEHVSDKVAARKLNEIAKALNGSSILFNSGQWNECVRLSEHAYESMRALGLRRDAGWRAQEIIWIHYHRADTAAADRWADLCDEAWMNSGSRLEQAALMRLRGLLRVQRGDYDGGVRLFQDALVIVRDLKLDDWVAVVLNDLGMAEHRRKHYEDAEAHYCEALKIHQQRDETWWLPAVLGNLASVSLARERLAEAREFYEKELLLAREVRRQDLIADAQFGLACVYETDGQVTLALPLAQEALSIQERLRHKDLPETRELVTRLKKAAGSHSPAGR
jgi:tetratricopeptide (TPR) repeat protein